MTYLRRLKLRLWSWRQRHKPRARELLIKVTLRDGTERERRANIEPQLFEQLCDGLVGQVDIKNADVYERVFGHHKSYAEDFDPARLMEAIKAMTPPPSPKPEGGA